MANARSDVALGAVSATIAAVLLVASYQEGAKVFLIPGDISPYFVPKAFLFSWIALSLAILAKGVASLAQEGQEPLVQNWRAIGGTFAVCVVATALMPILGYLLVAPVAVVISVWFMGYRNHVLNVVIALVVSVGLYLLLSQVAGLILPKAPWQG